MPWDAMLRLFASQEKVTAVLTASTTDVLSHVAIRARSQKVSQHLKKAPEDLMIL